MARCYAGTVMLEGTTLSEGRGTTRPLEGFGAPDLDVRALLAAMRTTRPEIDDSPTAIRAAKQAALLGFVEHRIGALVGAEREASVLPEEVAALVSPERTAAAARSVLAVVPEQPELPIPAPAPVAAAPIALVRPALEIPEVSFAVTAPVKPPEPEPVAVATVVAPQPSTPVAPPAAIAATIKASPDPVAAIMALSEAERIALFT